MGNCTENTAIAEIGKLANLAAHLGREDVGGYGAKKMSERQIAEVREDVRTVLSDEHSVLELC
jgi:hypothetical protein